MTDPDRFESVIPLDRLRPGAMQRCHIGGRAIVVCRTREGVFAVDNICTHAEARMDEGRLRGMRIVCPLHGASFDVRDGRVLNGPAVRPLAAHPVRVVDGVIQVAVAPEASS